MPANLLLVEDDLAVREAVRFHLQRAGYRVTAAETASKGWAHLPGKDAVLLDWTLPDEPGIVWLRRLRVTPAYARLPVLLLTARGSEADRVDGLDAGADDYLTKPFSAAELAARVRALLRRGAPDRPSGPVTIGDLTLDAATGIVTLTGRELNLTRREFDLLAFLAGHPDRVYSREELLDRVWGEDFIGGARTVDQHVTQLRAHLAGAPSGDRYIETVRGRGYRMRSEP